MPERTIGRSLPPTAGRATQPWRTQTSAVSGKVAIGRHRWDRWRSVKWIWVTAKLRQPTRVASAVDVTVIRLRCPNKTFILRSIYGGKLIQKETRLVKVIMLRPNIWLVTETDN